MRAVATTRVLACLALGAALLGGAGCRAPSEPPFLAPGAPRAIRVATDGAPAAFRLQVDDATAAVRIAFEHAEGDLDLYARFARPIQNFDSDADFKAESFGYSDELLLDRAGDPPLESGVYYVYVTAAETDVRRDGHWMQSLGCEISAHLMSMADLGRLAPGEMRSATLAPENALRATYRLQPGAAREPLRLDVVAPGQDVDLWVTSGEAAAAPREAELATRSAYGAPMLVVVPADDIEDTSAVFITVSAPLVAGAEPVPFEIFATRGREPPASLVSRPLTWPRAAPGDALGNTVLSTLEIHTADAGSGSGVLVSPAGYVLTNHHVVVGPRAEPWGASHITLAMTVDASRPPIELFRAEVVASDPDMDLALLHLSSGLYGAALPAGEPLPFVRPAAGPVPRLGEPLTVIGYPETGGDVARPTISLSHGVVSGYVRRGKMTQIKTDAEISAGNSGGPVLDALGHLVGVASAVIEESGGTGRLGYVVPWTNVPEEWKARIAADRAAGSGRAEGLGAGRERHDGRRRDGGRQPERMPPVNGATRRSGSRGGG